jgi:hypothetical protein
VIPVIALLAAAEIATICADRPSKANGACTVPAGHWQLEVSAVDWTRTRDGGSRTDVTSFGQTFVKLGLTDNSDMELVTPAYVRVRSRDALSSEQVSGFGDISVRYKHRLTDTSASAQVGVIPFVKLPTARHALGNGRVEGGIIVPLSLATKGGPTITLGPEADLLADGDGHGYHAGIVNLVNVGFNATPRLSLSAELWNSLNFDPAGTVRQWSLDPSVAFLPSNRVQFDAGANFGLNRATPDVELYAGASILF